VTLVALSIT